MKTLILKRPGTGTIPIEMKYVLVKKHKNDVKADVLINWNDLY